MHTSIVDRRQRPIPLRPEVRGRRGGAGAEARAFACEDGFAEETFKLTLSSTAKALAEAVSQVDVFCESQGGPETTGCALGEANIRATAESTVQPLPI